MVYNDAIGHWLTLWWFRRISYPLGPMLCLAPMVLSSFPDLWVFQMKHIFEESRPTSTNEIKKKKHDFCLYLCVCVCIGVSLCHMCKYQIPYSWSDRQQWVASCGCWGPNSDPLEKQRVLLTTVVPLLPSSFRLVFIVLNNLLSIFLIWWNI